MAVQQLAPVSLSLVAGARTELDSRALFGEEAIPLREVPWIWRGGSGIALPKTGTNCDTTRESGRPGQPPHGPEEADIPHLVHNMNLWF